MVRTAYIKLWGELVGAVAWDEKQQIASFEYDTKFLQSQLQIAPIKMPLVKRIFSFPDLRGNPTFKGLPGLLADVLPDRYGTELINIWLAQNGRPEGSLNPVELMCFIGARGMGALEFEPSIAPSTKPHTLEISSLIATTQRLLNNKEAFRIHTDDEMRDVLLEVLKMGTSAGGARPKAIIAYNEKTGEIRSGQTLAKGFEHWLLKFDGVNDTQFGASHGYGRVEMAYYGMATSAGLDMMESRLIQEEGRATL